MRTAITYAVSRQFVVLWDNFVKVQAEAVVKGGDTNNDSVAIISGSDSGQ